MHRNSKTQKNINIQRHLLLIGKTGRGLNCIPARNLMKKFINEPKHPIVSVFDDKMRFKRIKTNEGVIRTFSYPKYTKIFLSKLEKRFFKKFKKPIFSKIENNGKKVTYKIGEKI